MVAPLRTASISAPGFYGLNTMDSEVTLNQGFARSAENCVIDEGGRLGSRKGWQYLAQTNPVSQVDLQGLHRFVDVTGQEFFGCWSDTAFYIKTASYLNAVTYNGSNTLTTGNWQAATLNDAAYLFQRGYEPIYFDPTAGSLDDVNNTANTATTTAGTLTGISNATSVSIDNANLVTITNTKLVTITNSGTTATVNQVGHNFTTGDTVVINDADQAEYNGTFTITVLNADDYTYTMASSPSGNATGAPTATGVVAYVASTNHGLSNGDAIDVSGSNLSDYNGSFTVTVIDNNNYWYTMAATPQADPTGIITVRSELATVTHPSHGLSTGDTVIVSGASPSDYNGTFTVTKVSDNVYTYLTTTVASGASTTSTLARTLTAVVTSVGHELYTGNSVTITGSTPTGYNGTFTVTRIDNNSYSYTLASIETSDASGTLTASWDKGTPPQANTVLSAYGRLWVADTPNNKTTVYWSDLLDGNEWRTDVGTVGQLDITGILVNGNDEIVSLGAHNGYLIIFCKNNIIIMSDKDSNKQYISPADLQLVEVIHGVGCVARDSVVNTGTDIFFLSESGVRSLGRTIQEKSQPVRDISRNVRDTLVEQVSRANKDRIRAVYSDHFAFYLLAIPDETTVWCFDMRAPLETGAHRVTRWNNLDHTGWLAFDGEMYMTNTHGIAMYSGYQDNGDKYSMQYFTNYFDFDMQNVVKVLKNIAATVIGATGQKFVAKVGTDYEDIYTSYNLFVKQAANYEYNIAGFGLSTTTAAATQGASTVTVEFAQPTITGATQANPCVITSTGHSLTTGDEVFIDNVTGMTSLNGNKYTVNVLTANTFELVGVDSTLYNAYVSGGDLTHLDSYTVNFNTTVGAVYNTAYKVWLDADGFYYARDNGSRTMTILYTPATDWASEYSGSALIENIRIPIGGSGFVVQLGFESEIDGGYLNIQQIDLYAKSGRLN